MNLELTGEETGEELVKLLVKVRHNARILDKARTGFQSLSARCSLTLKTLDEQVGKAGQAELKASAERHAAEFKTQLMEIRFAEIELGHFTMALSRHLDEKAVRERVLDALNVGLAARNSPEVQDPETTTAMLIYGLQLENSSERRPEGWHFPPLAWCCHLAMMNKMKTNREFDRAAHDALNEVFNGYWGEYRERPLMERLAGRAV
ncbi:MAG: hypothetical protein RJB68_2493 [Pseudomonadota bacterium]